MFFLLENRRIVKQRIYTLILTKINSKMANTSRGREVVSHEAHNLEAWVQFPAPQHFIIIRNRAGVAQWLERALHKR